MCRYTHVSIVYKTMYIGRQAGETLAADEIALAQCTVRAWSFNTTRYLSVFIEKALNQILFLFKIEVLRW